MAQLNPLGVYDTATLVKIVPNLLRSQKFLLERFFPNVIEYDTEYVAIDVDVGKRRLAPFVSPLVEGRLVEQRRYQTNMFKPAYIKDKRAPDLLKPVRRMIGEKIGGEMSAKDRFQANLVFEMEDQVDMIDRRLEWMAAQALATGTVTIQGDGFPTQLVDFGRSPSLSVALTGAAQWGQPGISPTGDLMAWSQQILRESGAVPTDVIFTPSAWSAFLTDPIIRQAAWFAGGGAGNNVTIGTQVRHGGMAMGNWGQFNLYVYNDWYIDPDTDIQFPMIPDGTVILTSPELDGVRAFGQIIDPEFSYQAMAYAPKMWVNKDPAQLYLLMQSAPIVVPSRVNAAMSARVCASVYN